MFLTCNNLYVRRNCFPIPCFSAFIIAINNVSCVHQPRHCLLRIRDRLALKGRHRARQFCFPLCQGKWEGSCVLVQAQDVAACDRGCCLSMPLILQSNYVSGSQLVWITHRRLMVPLSAHVHHQNTGASFPETFETILFFHHLFVYLGINIIFVLPYLNFLCLKLLLMVQAGLEIPM